MKKIFSILFLLTLSIGVSTMVFAESKQSVNRGGDNAPETVVDTGTSCSPVTASNYPGCCGVGSQNANAAACSLYQNGGGDLTPPTTTNSAGQCNDIQGFNHTECCITYYAQNKVKCDAYDHGYYTPGTLGSGVPATTIYNGTDSSQNTAIGSAPQSSSAELARCSAIKFLSLLDILIWVKCIILVAIIPIIFALALMFFLWGVFKFIAASDSAKKEEGKKFIVAGLIGLFVMTSLWGIINIVSTTLGTGSAVPLLQTTYLKK